MKLYASINCVMLCPPVIITLPVRNGEIVIFLQFPIPYPDPLPIQNVGHAQIPGGEPEGRVLFQKNFVLTPWYIAGS